MGLRILSASERLTITAGGPALAVLVALFLVGWPLLGPARPVFAQVPSYVYVSNVSHTSFTVSWVTDVASTGSVRWGRVDQDLSHVSYDTRGQSYEGTTHYVAVNGLEASTEYRFELLSGSAVSSTRYSVVTAPPLQASSQPISLFGHVYSSGTTPVSEAIVLVQIVDRDGLDTTGRSQWLSTVTRPPNGDWDIPIGNVRTENRGELFRFSLQGDEVLVKVDVKGAETSATVDTRVNSASDAQPIDIAIGGTPTAATATPTPTEVRGESPYPEPETSPSPLPTEPVSEPTQPPEDEFPAPGPTDTPAPDVPTAEPTWTPPGQESPAPPEYEPTEPPKPSPAQEPTQPGQEASTPADGNEASPETEAPRLSPARITATALAAKARPKPSPTPAATPSVWPTSGATPVSASSGGNSGGNEPSSSTPAVLTLATIFLTLASAGVLGSLWYQASKNRSS